jgi:hypothetical protein
VVPIAVLLETPNLRRCSLPPIPYPIRLVLHYYIATLPMWECDLLVHAIDKALATPLYEFLLQFLLQEDTMLPPLSSVTMVSGAIKDCALFGREFDELIWIHSGLESR